MNESSFLVIMKFTAKRNLYLSILFFICNLPLQAQYNNQGIPIIKNYSPKTYAAGESNWSVARDNRGIMYFGNNNTILQYDGYNWNKIPVPDQTYVRSLVSDHKGTIYAGGIDDFGRLVSNNYGNTIYESLSSLINDSIKITSVWKTYADSQYIYFCTLQYIFKYHIEKEEINAIKLNFENNFWSFYLNHTLYIGNYNQGLLYLDSNAVKPLTGGDYYQKKDIFSILPWDKNKLLIATREEGLSFYNKKTGKVSPFSFNKNAISTNQMLLNSSVYAGVKIDCNTFAYGTIVNGLIVFDKSGKIKLHLDEETGLQDEIITNLYMPLDGSGVLWLTTSNGISSVNISSPVRQFANESGLNGTIYGIAKHHGKQYYATMLNVFMQKSLPDQKIKFEAIEGISGEIVYSLLNFKTKNGKEKLLAATVKDIYEIKGNRAHPLHFDIETNRIIQSKTTPHIIYAATSRGIKKIIYENSKFVLSDSQIGNQDQAITRIVEDKNGNLWCNTLSELLLVDSEGEIKPLPTTIRGKHGFFFKFTHNLYFSEKDTIYKYNYLEKKFKPDTELNKLYPVKAKVLKDFFPLNDTLAFAHYETGNFMQNELLLFNHGNWAPDTLSYNIIPSMTISTAFVDYPLIFMGGQDGLYIANESRKKDFFIDYYALLRSIKIGTDSIVFKGGKGIYPTINEEKRYKLTNINPIDYKYNNIMFSFAAPFYEKEEDMVYQSKLVGFDNQWSPWKPETSRTYTNLSEGTYQFMVKAKNIYEVNSKTSVYEFEILPPWYRTWWAYLIYVILALVTVRLIIGWYTRKLQEDKRKLEKIVKERTAEIVEKNARIESQNVAITDSIRYAKRIQTAVLPDKQTSSSFEYFIYFKPKDIVSGDFYWIYHFEKQKRLIVVAADCTGHGVPGAFMSMLGTSFLNEIVSKLDVIHSEVILNLLRDNVIKTLSQGNKEDGENGQKDGMDMALASIDLEKMVLEFSGANNPLILIRDKEVHEFKPDKMPIGSYIKQNQPFNRQEIKLQKNDVFYIFSDGYVDQFGGEKGRKYMKKRFKEYLLSIHSRPLDIQKQLLTNEMSKWMKGHEQIDDQIVIGMRLIKE